MFKNPNRKVLAALAVVIGLLWTGSGVALATSTKDSRANDHVLIGTHHDFEEFFKRDGESKGVGQAHNNYLYTSSAAVDAPPPGKCVVVTANSEQTIAISCNYASK
jgi:hypothetical protein